MALQLPAIVVLCLASLATVNVGWCAHLLTLVPLWKQCGWSHHGAILLLVYHVLNDTKIHVTGYLKIIISLLLSIL